MAARVRARGFREVGALAAARLRENVSFHEELVVLARTTAPRGTGHAAEGLAFRELGPSDADDYARRVGTESAAGFRARLSEFTKCYAAQAGGAIVHTSWVTTRCAWTREVRAWFCVSRGAAYVYESFTHPDARGKGVYPFALNEICSRLADRNVDVLVVAVELGNESSLRAVAKAGFEEKFRIGVTRRLGKLRLTLPHEVKTDTTTSRGLRNRRIWLTGDGASKQWER